MQKCLGKCRREDYRLSIHKDKVERVKAIKIYEAKKELFEEGKMANEAALEKEINIMFELWKKILEDIQKIKNSLIELDRIALKARVFTNEEYFKEMT